MNLERLAGLVNARWPQFGDWMQVKTNPLGQQLTGWVEYVPWEGDSNAKWIIWCLDRLEELKTDPVLRPFYKNGERAGFICNLSDDVTDPAPTRAEACALALMQALEGK